MRLGQVLIVLTVHKLQVFFKHFQPYAFNKPLMYEKFFNNIITKSVVTPGLRSLHLLLPMRLFLEGRLLIFDFWCTKRAIAFLSCSFASNKLQPLSFTFCLCGCIPYLNHFNGSSKKLFGHVTFLSHLYHICVVHNSTSAQ